MKSIAGMFKVNPDELFVDGAQYGWEQHAPVVDGNVLGFNQINPHELSKIRGAVVISRSVAYDGLQLVFRTSEQLLHGIRVADTTYPTYPYDSIVVQDTYEKGVNFELCHGDVSLPLTNIPMEDRDKASISFAAAVFNKWLTQKA